MDYRFLLSPQSGWSPILSYLVLNAAFSLAFVLLTMPTCLWETTIRPPWALVMFMDSQLFFQWDCSGDCSNLSAFLKKIWLHQCLVV